MKDQVSVIYDNVVHVNKRPETDPGSVLESVMSCSMQIEFLCENERNSRQKVCMSVLLTLLGSMDSATCVIPSRHFPMMGRICRSTSANVFSDSPIRSILFSSITWIFCSQHTHTELACVFLNRELRDHANCLLGACLCCYLICIIHNSEFRNNANKR